MKIRVSMQGAYMVMELEDGQARRMFWKMAELLRLAGGKKAARRSGRTRYENSGDPTRRTETDGGTAGRESGCRGFRP